MTDPVVTEDDGTITVHLDDWRLRGVVRVGMWRWLSGWTREVSPRIWAKKRSEAPEVRWRAEADQCAGELAVHVWLQSLGIETVWNALYLRDIPRDGDVSTDRLLPVEVRTVTKPTHRLWIFAKDPGTSPFVLAETTSFGVVRLVGWATKEQAQAYGTPLIDEPRHALDRDYLRPMSQLVEDLLRRPQLPRRRADPHRFSGRWRPALHQGEPPELAETLHSEWMTADAREVACWTVGTRLDLAAWAPYFNRVGWPQVAPDGLGGLALVLVEPRK